MIIPGLDHIGLT